MAISLLKKIPLTPTPHPTHYQQPPPASLPAPSVVFSPSVQPPQKEGHERGAAAGMIRWMSSSLLGGDHEDMVVFECVTVAGEGCRCLEGCYGEVLRDCVFQQGYDASV